VVVLCWCCCGRVMVVLWCCGGVGKCWKFIIVVYNVSLFCCAVVVVFVVVLSFCGFAVGLLWFCGGFGVVLGCCCCGCVVVLWWCCGGAGKCGKLICVV